MGAKNGPVGWNGLSEKTVFFSPYAHTILIKHEKMFVESLSKFLKETRSVPCRVDYLCHSYMS